jgi:hypothetical protein
MKVYRRAFADEPSQLRVPHQDRVLLIWRKADSLQSLMAMLSREVGGQYPAERPRSWDGGAASDGFAMREMLTMTKWCPVCGDAMGRVPTDGCSIVFRCHSCRTEIAKPAPRDNQRRRRSVRERRGGRIQA